MEHERSACHLDIVEINENDIGRPNGQSRIKQPLGKDAGRKPLPFHRVFVGKGKKRAHRHHAEKHELERQRAAEEDDACYQQSNEITRNRPCREIFWEIGQHDRVSSITPTIYVSI